MKWKGLVASAPAEPERKFDQNCSECSARVWSGCTGSLTRWEKPALSSSLEECSLFFLSYFSFPGDFLGFINDCISLRHDSCSFTSSRVNLESGQAKMLNPSFLLPVLLWPPLSFPISAACIAITWGLAFSLQDWAEIQVLYRAKQISSILARQSKMLEHMWLLLADFSPSLMFGRSVKFPLKYA